MTHRSVLALFARPDDARRAAEAMRGRGLGEADIDVFAPGDLVHAPLRTPSGEETGSGARHPRGRGDHKGGDHEGGGFPVGAFPGGLVGRLASAGVPEEHGVVYAEAVIGGAALLVARAGDDEAAAALAAVLDAHGAEDLGPREAASQEMGLTRFDEAADSFGVVEISDDRLGTEPAGPLADAAARMRAASASGPAARPGRARIYLAPAPGLDVQPTPVARRD
jgi:hypothetical protein